MMPSPAPRFYLIGVIVSGVGALVLALTGRARRLPGSRPRPLLVAGAVTVAIGLAVIGAGLWADAVYKAEMNSSTLWYSVSVTTNGTGPLRIVLPAPSDARFYEALNATNGSSTLRLNGSGSEASVVLTAFGNVSFQVRAELPTASVNRSFTRLDGQPWGSSRNAMIEMVAPLEGAAALVRVDASIGLPCTSSTLHIDSWVTEGTGWYPAQTATMVC